MLPLAACARCPRRSLVLASVRSATLVGVDGQPVTVEVHVSTGLPAYSVVGLPDTAVREARERVRAALLSSGASWPMKRITVNLCNTRIERFALGKRCLHSYAPAVDAEGFFLASTK